VIYDQIKNDYNELIQHIHMDQKDENENEEIDNEFENDINNLEG